MTCCRYKYVGPIIITYSKTYNVFRMCNMSGNDTCCLYYLICVLCYATSVILRHAKLHLHAVCVRSYDVFIRGSGFVRSF